MKDDAVLFMQGPVEVALVGSQDALDRPLVQPVEVDLELCGALRRRGL
jgi:hypothetical protein